MVHPHHSKLHIPAMCGSPRPRPCVLTASLPPQHLRGSFHGAGRRALGARCRPAAHHPHPGSSASRSFRYLVQEWTLRIRHLQFYYSLTNKDLYSMLAREKDHRQLILLSLN